MPSRRTTLVTAAVVCALGLTGQAYAQAANYPDVCDPSITQNAERRHALRLKIAKESNDPIDVPALERAKQERIDELCAINIRAQKNGQETAANWQESAANRQETAANRQETAANRQETAAKEQSAAANRQETLLQLKVTPLLEKIRDNTHSKSDIIQLQALYQEIFQVSSGKSQILPNIANLLKKLGVTV